MNCEVNYSDFKQSSVVITGYKHAAVPIIALSAYLNTKITLKNVPKVEDTFVLIKILELFGSTVSFDENTLILESNEFHGYEIPQSLNEKVHGTLYLIPTILGRLGKIKIGQSGGCQIGDEKLNGSRPIHHIVDVLEKFGAEFIHTGNILEGTCKEFKACEINIMDYSNRVDIINGPLVSGATKTAILAAACTKKGTTIIRNPYYKPDVTEILSFLSLAGYDIQSDKDTISISPPCTLKQPTHYLVSDITEIITYISCSIYMNHPLTLKNVTVNRVKEALKPELEFLKEMGINLKWNDNSIYVPQVKRINPVDIDVVSMGIYSDSQPFFTLMLLRGDNKSRITDHVWTNRFRYAIEMKKIGIKLEIEDNTVFISPGYPCSASTLYATDLRAAAVLILASLKAPGKTTIKNVDHLTRGYENFIETLQFLGADVTLCKEKYEEGRDLVETT